MSRTVNHVTGVRETVRRRAGGLCECCGKPFVRRQGGMLDASLHHRHKKEYGGRDSVTNLIHVHDSCHRALHDDEDQAARLGLILWEDESAWKPVFLKLDDSPPFWAVLTSDGEYRQVDGWLAAELLGGGDRPGYARGARPGRRQGRRVAA